MSDHEKSQELLSQIGRKLWSAMPQEASEIYYAAYFHDDMTSGGIVEWLNKDGTVGFYTPALPRPYELDEEIRLLADKLRQSDIFSKPPWTHVKFILNDQAKLTSDFAYVHDEDAHPNLYMKGIPDLDRRQAYEEYGVSSKDWMVIARRAVGRMRLEADRAAIAGNLDLRGLLANQIRDIERRLVDADGQ